MWHIYSVQCIYIENECKEWRTRKPCFYSQWLIKTKKANKMKQMPFKVPFLIKFWIHIYIKGVLPFSRRDNYTETKFVLILSFDDECFQIIISFLVSAQYISSSLKNIINLQRIILTRKWTHSTPPPPPPPTLDNVMGNKKLKSGRVRV